AASVSDTRHFADGPVFMKAALPAQELSNDSFLRTQYQECVGSRFRDCTLRAYRNAGITLFSQAEGNPSIQEDSFRLDHSSSAIRSGSTSCQAAPSSASSISRRGDLPC